MIMKRDFTQSPSSQNLERKLRSRDFVTLPDYVTFLVHAHYSSLFTCYIQNSVFMLTEVASDNVEPDTYLSASVEQ